MSNFRIIHLFVLFLLVIGLGFVNSAQANEAESTRVPLQLKTKANIIEVNTTGDVTDPSDGRCTLREAIILANTNPAPGGLMVAGECTSGRDDVTDRIVLEGAETYHLTIVYGGEDNAIAGDLDIHDNSAALDLEIMSNNGQIATIDASGLGDRIFQIWSANVSFAYVSLRNADSSEDGGAVYNESGTLHFSHVPIGGNSAINGGGLYNLAGEITMIDSVVHDNDATGAGGGIYNSGVLYLDSIEVAGNDAENNGGGIANEGGDIIFSNSEGDSEFWFNQAETRGGALNNAAGTVTGHGVDFSWNTVVGFYTFGTGGAIHNELGGTIELADTEIENNEAEEVGDGIYNKGPASSVQLTDAFVFGHDLHSGITNEGSLILVNVDVYDNEGSGIVSDGGTVSLQQSELFDNTGRHGGGLVLKNSAAVDVNQSAIYNNTAQTGAGIYVSESSLAMTNSTVSGNNTTFGIGGGIHFHGGFAGQNVDFVNVTIANNTSSSNAGSAIGFVANTLDIEMVNTILAGPANSSVCFNGVLVSSGHNIVSDGSCLALVQVSDQITDPLLSGLGTIGSTMAHVPQAGSPAIGGGDDVVCQAAPVSAVDQAGQARNIGCEIGAIES